MKRSSKETWLTGPGDLKEVDVEDVPVPGESVRVRGLPARYSAEVASQMKVTQEGRDQVARVDTAEMEILQFAYGVVQPEFSPAEARIVAEKYGPAFKKVIDKIDELSGIDKEEIAEAEARFPSSGAGEADAEANGSSPGSDRPSVPARAGA